MKRHKWYVNIVNKFETCLLYQFEYTNIWIKVGMVECGSLSLKNYTRAVLLRIPECKIKTRRQRIWVSWFQIDAYN